MKYAVEILENGERVKTARGLRRALADSFAAGYLARYEAKVVEDPEPYDAPARPVADIEQQLIRLARNEFVTQHQLQLLQDEVTKLQTEIKDLNQAIADLQQIKR
jgi:hypothetical protein